MRFSSLCFVFGAFLVGTLDVLAAPPEVDGFHPAFGASGDLVYVQGKGIGAASRVLLQGQPAEVLRASDEALVCRVPEGLDEGGAELSVGGHVLRDRFLVLAKGRPVIHGSSSSAATPGQAVLVHGRRLGGGRGEFVDMGGVVAGRTDVVGGRRVVAIRVPSDLPPGHYRLRLTNARGLTSLWSSPNIQVVAGDYRRVFTARRGRVCPGQRVTFKGTDLGPLGSCDVRWSRSDGSVCCASGWSNGYDRITVVVPHALRVGQWHRLLLAPPGGAGRGVSRVYAQAAERPHRLVLDSDAAMPGETLGIQGMPVCGLGGSPHVLLARGAFRVPARTLFLHPGGLGHGRSWVVRLPDRLEEGEHEVSVRVNGIVIDAGSLRVSKGTIPTANAAR